MPSLDSLPADQRAVLQLVLQRGRSYDQIAQLLSIDRGAVRARALEAFDALGPQTRVPPERRALITDYLMGQLPPKVAEQIHDRLAESATERSWARVLAGEIGPIAKDPLPEIPVGAARRATRAAEPTAAGAAAGATAATGAAAADAPTETGKDGPAGDGVEPERRIPPDYGLPEPDEHSAARTSRRGGAILLGLGALVAVVVVVVVLATGGSSKHHAAAGTTGNTGTTTATGATTANSGATTANTGTTSANSGTVTGATTASTPANTSTSGAATTTPGSTSTTKAQVIGQVNLSSPTSAKGVGGVAQVIKSGTQIGIVIVAQGVAANTKHDAYAVWLYNSAGDNKLLGFVNPGVKPGGKLQTEGVLPANAAHYKELLVSLETQPKPSAPDKIVLEGALSIS